MGAWSHEPFGNDTANDWAYELESSKDLSYVEAALDKAIGNGVEYLEAPDAEEAIAAIEVLAKLLGKGTQSDAYTEKVDDWVNSCSLKPGTQILAKAQHVLGRVVSSESELLELWEEDDGGNPWKESIKSLQVAVGS